MSAMPNVKEKAAQKQLEVLVVSPSQVMFEGRAQSLSFPGEQGVFEILPLHRSLLSRLVKGELSIDGRSITIRRGVVRVASDRVIAVIETV